MVSFYSTPPRGTAEGVAPGRRSLQRGRTQQKPPMVSSPHFPAAQLARDQGCCRYSECTSCPARRTSPHSWSHLTSAARCPCRPELDGLLLSPPSQSRFPALTSSPSSLTSLSQSQVFRPILAQPHLLLTFSLLFFTLLLSFIPYSFSPFLTLILSAILSHSLFSLFLSLSGMFVLSRDL